MNKHITPVGDAVDAHGELRIGNRAGTDGVTTIFLLVIIPSGPSNPPIRNATPVFEVSCECRKLLKSLIVGKVHPGIRASRVPASGIFVRSRKPLATATWRERLAFKRNFVIPRSWSHGRGRLVGGFWSDGSCIPREVHEG